MFQIFLVILKFTLYISAYALVLYLWFFLWVHIGRRKTIEKEGLHYTPPPKRKKKFHPITDIFIRWPYQVGKDQARSDPNAFPYKGIVVFTGEQGSGKTISMMQYARAMKEEYPDSYVLSNTQVSFQDEFFTTPEPIFTRKNGDNGLIIILDECQNYFNSKMSKDMPPELLSTVTQNRKSHRILLMTSQSFYMLAKDIRTMSNTGEIRSCHTFLNSFTIVFRRHPTFDNDGNLVKLKFLGLYAFVHDDDLRNCYDTYALVENLYKSGFKPYSERIGFNNNTYTNNYNYYYRRKK